MKPNTCKLVEHLSILLDDQVLKERELLKQEVGTVVVGRLKEILNKQSEEEKQIADDIAAATGFIKQTEPKLAAIEMERRNLEACMLTCPSQVLRDLYGRKAYELKAGISELAAMLNEARTEVERLNGQLEEVKVEARRSREETKRSPLVVLRREVVASVRRELMNWIDIGRYADAEQAALQEGDPRLLEEVRRQAIAKKIAVSAAKRILLTPEALDLPRDAWAIGRNAEVLIAINKQRQECARFAVSPRGQLYPLRRSNRHWNEEGGVHFCTLKDLIAKKSARMAPMMA